MKFAALADMARVGTSIVASASAVSSAAIASQFAFQLYQSSASSRSRQRDTRSALAAELNHLRSVSGTALAIVRHGGIAAYTDRGASFGRESGGRGACDERTGGMRTLQRRVLGNHATHRHAQEGNASQTFRVGDLPDRLGGRCTCSCSLLAAATRPSCWLCRSRTSTRWASIRIVTPHRHCCCRVAGRRQPERSPSRTQATSPPRRMPARPLLTNGPAGPSGARVVKPGLKVLQVLGRAHTDWLPTIQSKC